MYVFLFVCMYVCVYVCMYLCMCVWVYACTKFRFGEVTPKVHDIDSRLLQYFYHTNVKVKVTLKQATKTLEGE